MAITLNVELEERIRERIDAGEASSVDAFVERAIRRALECTGSETESNMSPDRLTREADELFAALDRDLPAGTPNLSGEALRREAIYEGIG